MEYICNHCKRFFDEPREYRYEECVGEYWGTPAYQTFVDEYCPYCGDDDFEEYYEDDEEEEDEDE